MIESFENFNQSLKNENIRISNPGLNTLLKNYIFIHYLENSIISHDEIIKNVKKSKVIMVNQCDYQYFVLGFEQTIIIFNLSTISILHQ